MKPLELAQLAIAGMSRTPPGVQLVIPQGKYPRPFPRGELLCELQNGDRVYLFSKPGKILECLISHDLITVIKKDGDIFVEEKH